MATITMTLISYFSQNGTPSTGLSATIDIWQDDATQDVTATAMTEIAGGFYKYDFTTYDEDTNYVFRADGSATLSGNDRYVFGSNETAGVGNLLKVQKNRWKIESNQLKIYDDDGATVIYTFDLKDAAGDASSASVFEREPS